MLNFLDVYERTLQGPVISEKEFNMKVFVPALRDVVSTYGIKYDRDNLVLSDNGVADNLYEAAVEFFSRVGVYCATTNRVIHFTREEIGQAVKEAPGKCYLGEGKDAGVFGMRGPDDRRVPWCSVGWSWICTSEEMATNQLEALATLSGADSLDIPAVRTLRGIPFSGGSPGEMYAAIRQVRIGREAARRAGRPGMAITNSIGTASTAVTTIAASAPQFGLRPTDGWLVGIMSEMKIDYDLMNRIAYLLAWGANIGSHAAPMLGGWCGGVEGTAVTAVASILLGLLVHKGSYHLAFPLDSRYSCNTTGDLLCVSSAACQASSRNIPVPVLWCGYNAAGVNTRMYFYESAAYFLTVVTSGAPGVTVPAPAKGVKVDGSTPMEDRFEIEVSRAAAKLTRERANELVPKLLEKYESDIAQAPEGDRYQDCYDVERGEPKEGYVRLYDEVKEELFKMGIPFD
jgi:hypothetical protein